MDSKRIHDEDNDCSYSLVTSAGGLLAIGFDPHIPISADLVDPSSFQDPWFNHRPRV